TYLQMAGGGESRLCADLESGWNRVTGRRRIHRKLGAVSLLRRRRSPDRGQHVPVRVPNRAAEQSHGVELFLLRRYRRRSGGVQQGLFVYTEIVCPSGGPLTEERLVDGAPFPHRQIRIGEVPGRRYVACLPRQGYGAGAASCREDPYACGLGRRGSAGAI